MSKKSTVVSDMGLGRGMFIIADQVRKEMGITNEQFYGLAFEAGRKDWQRLFEGMANKIQCDQYQYGTYIVTVNYNRSLNEMITAGRYDWVNDSIIPTRFPINGNGQRDVEITLIHRGRSERTQQLIYEMDMEYRPATHEELLALGEQYPELQQMFPIIALGTVVHVFCRLVLCLYSYHGKRGLYLHVFNRKYSQGYYRFAFVRKN